MEIYKDAIVAAPFLYWMVQFPSAVRETVEACSFRVVLPGYDVIERRMEVKNIQFMCAGSVIIDDLVDNEELEEEEEFNIYGEVTSPTTGSRSEFSQIPRESAFEASR